MLELDQTLDARGIKGEPALVAEVAVLVAQYCAIEGYSVDISVYNENFFDCYIGTPREEDSGLEKQSALYKGVISNEEGSYVSIATKDFFKFDEVVGEVETIPIG